MLGLLASLAFAEVPNGDFSEGTPGELPAGWFVPGPSEEAGVVAALTDEGTLSASSTGAGDWGTVMTRVPAAAWQDQRFTLRARVKVDRGSAQLWLREDTDPPETTGFFDNMGDRPITRGGWQEVEIAGRLSPDTHQLALGLILTGATEAELDDLRLELHGEGSGSDQGPRALAPGELEDLVALARAGAAVEYFHPTEAVREADWTRVLVAAIRHVEAEGLQAGLETVLDQVAPAVGFGEPPRWEGRLLRVEHLGLGAEFNPASAFMYPFGGPYRSELVRSSAEVAVLELGELRLSVPLAVPPDAPGQARVQVPDAPDDWEPDARDRSSRLAAVMRTWAVFEHFYPYETARPWDGVLEDALSDASVREDLGHTLHRVVAAAGDGHGYVTSSQGPRVHLPVELVVTDEGLVVSRVLGGGFHTGDVLIDPAVLAEERRLRERTSTATPQWLDSQVAERVVAVSPELEEVLVRRGDTELRLPVEAMEWGERRERLGEARIPSGTEVAPGIVYVDLRYLDDLGPYLPAMREAEGLVFDLRGYPGNAAGEVVRMLADEPVDSAWWLVPEVTSPTAEPGWDRSNWTWRPRLRGLDAPAVFLTDGSAISWAETVLGIVEAYEIAPIVGGATAGTNGNVNLFEPLDGYRIAFTGMRVVKHDGSPHHGVGVLPTHPVTPTREGLAEGRDEVLEAGIALLER